MEILNNPKSNLELRNNAKLVLTSFVIDQLRLSFSEQTQSIKRDIKEKEIRFPLDYMVFLLVKLTKEIHTHEYYTEAEITSKLERIVKILEELRKDV